MPDEYMVNESIKRRILLLTYYFPPKIGGGEDYLYNIYKRLPKDKVVVLADDKGDGGQADFDRGQNFKIYREKFFRGRFKPSWWHLIGKVKRIIQDEDIEVIHFGHYAHYVLIARVLKVPYLVYVQGSDLFSYTGSWFDRRLAKSNLNKTEKIIAISNFLKNNVVKLGTNSSKIEVVLPGLNFKEYDFDAENSQYEGLDRGPGINSKIILSVGRLVKVKGFDLVIKALPKIFKQVPEAIYVVVGEGEEKENLKDLAQELGVGDKVVFVGEVRDKKELSKYYRSALVYVGPSRAEGFGIVFLEARAFGLPIVASDVGGVKEAVGDRGVLVEPEDVNDLTQNVVEILKLGKKQEPDRSFSWEKRKRITELICN